MVSDIGGNLGLLLGASAFTLYEFLESCVRRLWRRSRRTGVKVTSAELREVKAIDSGVIGGLNTKRPAVNKGTLNPLAIVGEGATQISI